MTRSAKSSLILGENKGPYPLEQRTIGRFQSTNSSRGNTIGGQILNMFNSESRPTLQRIGHRLWRIGLQLYYPHTHRLIVEESALESVLESADSSSKSADSNADSQKISLWVWAFRLVFPERVFSAGSNCAAKWISAVHLLGQSSYTL